MFEVRSYLTDEGQCPVQDWLAALPDRQARARIATRLMRLEAGNPGDCKALSGGLLELRIDWGPGYRVYYARAGACLVLLLAGGDKRTQQADIATARRYWTDWQQRNAP